jgi:hypothetical protein
MEWEERVKMDLEKKCFEKYYLIKRYQDHQKFEASNITISRRTTCGRKAMNKLLQRFLIKHLNEMF